MCASVMMLHKGARNVYCLCQCSTDRQGVHFVNNCKRASMHARTCLVAGEPTGHNQPTAAHHPQVTCAISTRSNDIGPDQ